MEDSGDQQTGWRDSLPDLLFFLFIIVLFLVAVGWFVYFSMKAIENPEEDSAEEVVAETVEETVEEVGARDPVQVEFPYFDPGRVLNNPECRVRVAQAASVDTAVVLLPFAGGGRFAVVDATGILHAGELSFWPATFEVAKRRNGSVLTAFGHLTGEKSAEGFRDGLWPVRIFLDGKLILGHDSAWDFGLAGDGSSYYLVEPVGEDASRLVIRRPKEGAARRYKLKDLLPPRRGDDPVALISYSLDNSEVKIRPFGTQLETHRFYSTRSGGHDGRKAIASKDQSVTSVRFASSQEAYFLFDFSDMEGLALTRTTFQWGEEQVQEAHWQRELPTLYNLVHELDLSPDGAFLLLNGREVALFNTSSGRMVFRKPKDDAELPPHLQEMFGLEAVEDQVEFKTGSWFLGDELIMDRIVAMPDGRREVAYDVFDLEGIQLGSEPRRRIIRNSLSECAPGDHPLQGLQEHEGRLTFLTTRG